MSGQKIDPDNLGGRIERAKQERDARPEWLKESIRRDNNLNRSDFMSEREETCEHGKQVFQICDICDAPSSPDRSKICGVREYNSGYTGKVCILDHGHKGQHQLGDPTAHDRQIPPHPCDDPDCPSNEFDIEAVRKDTSVPDSQTR